MSTAAIRTRAAGVLLHPSSLPGPYGIGDIGPAALAWIEGLAAAGTRLWQVLPLGPTGYGDSPYQCFSSFAGNPYLISPDLLAEDGLLRKRELRGPGFPAGRVDYGRVIDWKLGLLDLAHDRFRRKRRLHAAYRAFQAEHAAWLGDFALFMALKDRHQLRPWTEWSHDLRTRNGDVLYAARRELAADIDRHVFRQFVFFSQWERVRRHAADHGVAIIGDIPIFVAPDSSDVWANPELFFLDAEGRSTVVAGVPPDYFSPTGQLWGNPLYDWAAHRATDYRWWLSRIQAVLQMVDVVRIDHFRAFADYWEIPAGAPTAERGRWVDGPGDEFFLAVRAGLGELPIIAEDLGDLSPAVPALRDRWRLPGMKILQFAFASDERDPFLPHTYPEACVAYTGTHDNDTTRGWLATAPAAERDFALRYLEAGDGDRVRAFLEGVWSSRARFAIAPLQDLLRLGTEARMNVPSVPAGNWQWRTTEQLPPGVGEELAELNRRYGR